MQRTLTVMVAALESASPGPPCVTLSRTCQRTVQDQSAIGYILWSLYGESFTEVLKGKNTKSVEMERDPNPGSVTIHLTPAHTEVTETSGEQWCWWWLLGSGRQGS